MNFATSTRVIVFIDCHCSVKGQFYKKKKENRKTKCMAVKEDICVMKRFYYIYILYGCILLHRSYTLYLLKGSLLFTKVSRVVLFLCQVVDAYC